MQENEAVFGVGPRCRVMRLDGRNRGYIVGAFMSEIYDFGTSLCEVAVMDLPTKDKSRPHMHQIMTEITYVIKGELSLVVKDISGVREFSLREGEYMVLDPGVIIKNPRNRKGTTVFVVKYPSVLDDKIYIDDSELDLS